MEGTQDYVQLQLLNADQSVTEAVTLTGSWLKCHVILCLVAWQQWPGGRQVPRPVGRRPSTRRWRRAGGRHLRPSEWRRSAAEPPVCAWSFFKIRAFECVSVIIQPRVNNLSAVLLAVKWNYFGCEQKPEENNGTIDVNNRVWPQNKVHRLHTSFLQETEVFSLNTASIFVF